jgi:hypothetical protein
MIGIFTEALIMEAVLLLTGRNILGYALGGAFAVLSSLLHKLANLLLIYGFDLIEVYMNMLNYAAAQLSLIKFTPQQLLYILVAIYLVAGMLGGFAGYYIGSRAGRIKTAGKPIRFADDANPLKLARGRFSLLLLIFHLSFIVLTLIFFQKSESLIFKTGISLTYLLFCLFYYNNISRRLLKPLFWIQLLIILVLAGLFLETSDPEKFSLRNAVTNGWNMFMRAMLVITSFSAISTELANPDIKQFLIKRGFRKLYMALQLSFSALPMMLERNSGLKSFFKNPVYSFSRLVAEAEDWFQSFKTQNRH